MSCQCLSICLFTIVFLHYSVSYSSFLSFSFFHSLFLSDFWLRMLTIYSMPLSFFLSRTLALSLSSFLHLSPGYHSHLLPVGLPGHPTEGVGLHRLLHLHIAPAEDTAESALLHSSGTIACLLHQRSFFNASTLKIVVSSTKQKNKTKQKNLFVYKHQKTQSFILRF